MVAHVGGLGCTGISVPPVQQPAAFTNPPEYARHGTVAVVHGQEELPESNQFSGPVSEPGQLQYTVHAGPATHAGPSVPLKPGPGV